MQLVISPERERPIAVADRLIPDTLDRERPVVGGAGGDLVAREGRDRAQPAAALIERRGVRPAIEANRRGLGDVDPAPVGPGEEKSKDKGDNGYDPTSSDHQFDQTEDDQRDPAHEREPRERHAYADDPPPGRADRQRSGPAKTRGKLLRSRAEQALVCSEADQV